MLLLWLFYRQRNRWRPGMAGFLVRGQRAGQGSGDAASHMSQLPAYTAPPQPQLWAPRPPSALLPTAFAL